MIGLGTTLRCNLPPRHIWVVLSDPSRTNRRILFVNLTTLRQDSADDACLLDPSDYPLLTHRTTVAYSRSEVGDATSLENAVHEGNFTELDPMPHRTLLKMIEGGHNSPELPKAKKALLPSL